VAVRRYRSQRVVSSLLLLASNFLSDKPPPRLPGKVSRRGGPFCPVHRSTELKPLNNDKLYCPKCPGSVFNRPRGN
jgi:hypothetical protein